MTATLPIVHGTLTAYRARGCRCPACKEWRRSFGEKERRRRGDETIESFHARKKSTPIKHGTWHAYKARGCRCDECRHANTQAIQRRRENQKGRTFTAKPLGKFDVIVSRVKRGAPIHEGESLDTTSLTEAEIRFITGVFIL